MQETTPARGSEKLLSALAAKGTSAGPDEIREALSLTHDSGFKVIRYFPKGVLAHELEATLFGPVEGLGEVVQRLAVHQSLRGINILINGLPAFETAEVTVHLATSAK